jgi:hypothetical protein
LVSLRGLRHPDLPRGRSRRPSQPGTRLVSESSRAG